jgi:hypothetical protein
MGGVVLRKFHPFFFKFSLCLCIYRLYVKKELKEIEEILCETNNKRVRDWERI